MRAIGRCGVRVVARPIGSRGDSQLGLLSVSALLFASSATVTAFWCASMSAMGEMPMPGGWAMSMTWMRMPGQTWLGAVGSFLGMWVVMMVTMMLPSLVPTLARYRRAVVQTAVARGHDLSLGWLTVLVGGGYFFVWTVFGVAAFAVGVALVTLEMGKPDLARVVPLAVGVIVLGAGALQFTAWKSRQLACCREVSGCARALVADAGGAWRYGLCLGLRCSYCCVGLTVVLLVIGVMDLRVMAAVTVAITVERLAPHGGRVARAVGVVVLGAGLLLVARAVSFP